LHQSDVARGLGWSLSKVQRIEAGEVTVSGTDLRALIDLYGGFAAEEIEELVEVARIARRQRWWTAAEYRQHLTPGLVQLLGFESEATAIRAFQPVLIPGVLQTAAVADHILSEDGALSPEDRKVRHDVRMLRRQQVIEREDPPAYYLVIDESVLLRDVGGIRLGAEQLEALATAVALPSVHVRVLPLDRGAIVGMLGPFMIIDLNEDDEGDAVVYRESWIDDAVLHDTKLVRSHRDYFEKLWHQCLDEEVSLRAILARAADLRSRADRST